jgi:hypothetical protein
MTSSSPQVRGYISEVEQAQRSGISIWTLRAWRTKGYGPRFVKFGRHVLYPEDAAERFLVEEQAAAQKGPRRRGRPRATPPLDAA